MAIDVEALYRRYGPMVLRRCRGLLREEQAAVDAMQDVFVQVLRHRERLQPHGCSSLLYRIATNVCLNRMRSSRRRPETPDSESLQRLAAAGAELDAHEARSLLGRVFGSEPASTATIAALHLHDGLTLEQTAARVGMSVSGVRKRLRKLKATLQEVERP